MPIIGEQLPDLMWRIDAPAFHERLAEETLTPGGPSPILLRDLAKRSAEKTSGVGQEFLAEIEYDPDSLATDDAGALYLASMAPFILSVEPVDVDWLVAEAGLGVSTEWLGEEVRLVRYGGALSLLAISLGYPDFAETLHGWRLNAGWLSATQAAQFGRRLAQTRVFSEPDRGHLRSLRWLEDNGIEAELLPSRLADAAKQLQTHLARIAAGGGHVVL